MIVTRLTNIFSVTTAPVNRSVASPHSGGWTESFWTTLNPSGFNPPWTAQQLRRAALLPGQASMIGFRSSVFNMTGNKLIPQGSSTGSINLPGLTLATVNLPQDSLSLTGAAAGATNTNKIIVRCMDDEVFTQGEYNPTPTFATIVSNFIASMVGTNFGFIGRDLTAPAQRVLSIAAGVMTLEAALPGVAIGDFIRLRKVVDENGKPVIGTFRVNAIAGAVYTMSAFPNQTVVDPSGTARQDVLAYFNFANITIGRAVSRKIGRPSQGYRGRRSKVQG